MWVDVWRVVLRPVRMREFDLQVVTAAKLVEMDPEFAFIDWREPEAAPEAAKGNWAELLFSGVDPQVRVAPGHAAS